MVGQPFLSRIDHDVFEWIPFEDIVIQRVGLDERWAQEPIDMAQRLDRQRLLQAFEFLGEALAETGAFIEIAVCGGSAMMLRFEWRQATEDVDALVRPGYDEAVLGPAVARVAGRLGLEPDWLNNAVGMFTPLDEDDTLFEIAGTYPASKMPGLRVVLARPRYLLAMKMKALGSFGRGERDMADARGLARHLGIADEDQLIDLDVSIQGEQPPTEARLRFRDILGGH